MNKFDWYVPVPENKTFLQPKESKLKKMKSFIAIVAVLSLPVIGALIQEYGK